MRRNEPYGIAFKSQAVPCKIAVYFVEVQSSSITAATGVSISTTALSYRLKLHSIVPQPSHWFASLKVTTQFESAFSRCHPGIGTVESFGNVAAVWPIQQGCNTL